LKAAVLVNNVKWSDKNVITLDLYWYTGHAKTRRSVHSEIY